MEAVTQIALTPIAVISIFTLSVFVGFEVVSKVSSTLHTPLMSGANAIHGVILVGAIIVASHSDTNLELALSVIAIVLATCLLYTSPSPRDVEESRMPSSA